MFHARGRERLEGARFAEQGPAVELDDPLEIGRLRNEVSGQLSDEGVLVSEVEQPIEAALEADRRPRLLAHPSAAAEGASYVARPGLREIVELEQAMHRRPELPGTFLGLDRQVGACEVADEERIPGDDEPGLLSAAGVGDQVGGVLR